jgi:hypothetical protein
MPWISFSNKNLTPCKKLPEYIVIARVAMAKKGKSPPTIHSYTIHIWCLCHHMEFQIEEPFAKI